MKRKEINRQKPTHNVVFTFNQDDTFETWLEVTYVNKDFERGKMKILGVSKAETSLSGEIITLKTLEYTPSDNSTMNDVLEYIGNVINLLLGDSSQSKVYIKFNGKTHEE